VNGQRFVAIAIVALSLFAIAVALRPRGLPSGNRLVVLNTGGSPLDSVVIGSEPPGANLLFAHAGAVPPRDSVWIALPRARGDADVRIYRGGIAVANHAVEFGGDSVFEIRVGDRDEFGRYRRMGR
jgi:hypothetical protein